MKRFIVYMLLAVCSVAAFAQGQVKGTVLDKNSDEPLSFVGLKVTPQGKTTFIKGANSDLDGNFTITGLSNGKYTLTISYVGYKTATRNFEITDKNHSVRFPFIHLSEDSKMLKEVTVTGQKSNMKLEVDRKSFDVSNAINSQGLSASEVLENVPSVEVDNDGNVSLRGNESVEVWINGKASGLTSDNRAQILQQLPAESIDHIEIIDNPSAKFSAEGSAGIINIVLKKDRKTGYYGSLQAGADTRGGANTSFNINYNSGLLDAYFNIGYRHRQNEGKSESHQVYLDAPQRYQDYSTRNTDIGNNLFSRAGITLHATDKDDFSVSGMMMKGKHHSWSTTPYYNGILNNGVQQLTSIQTRKSKTGMDMNMLYGEFNYRHNFSPTHYLDVVLDYRRWKGDDDNYYCDSVDYADDAPTTYSYQSRPLHMNNRSWEAKIDYENQISKNFKLQMGYQGEFSHENTPQESFDAKNWEGLNLEEDKFFYNRFIYDMDLHALYATGSLKLGNLGIMGGLRGEYWKVNTESYSYDQEYDASKRDKPFKKDYFELFPSLFMSYQLTENDQLQLNYTRRLRRPWGGQLNNFKNTRDATMISYGNPQLTPEFSNSFSLNYLKTWTEHSLLISAYYRPTYDVMQRISFKGIYTDPTTGAETETMYQTTFNVAKSTSTGVEVTLKNKFFRIMDLTTNVNGYYYKIDDFRFDVGDGQIVYGEGNHNFTWNARMMASFTLPYDISIQTSGRYRSRQSMAQGYRKSIFMMDFGLRKNFFNKALSLSINCRDLLDSRKFETFTFNDTFERYQVRRRGGRSVNFTLTWNFGNAKAKKRPGKPGEQGQGQEEGGIEQQYSGGGEE